jgi:acylphosphatase
MHKIKGIVRNLDDKVEIFCECKEKTLQKFIKLIRMKRKDSEDIFSPNVEDIKVYREQEEEYKEGRPPKEFKAFDIDYGEKLSRFEKESLTRTEIGSLLLVNTREKTMNVGEEAGRMHNDMNRSFEYIIDRYDHFSEEMKSFREILREMNKNFKKFVEYYIEKRKKRFLRFQNYL